MKTAKGIQLPPDSSGKITAGIKVQVLDETTGNVDDIIIPATIIVNAEGEEIGGKILKALESIASKIGRL